MCLLDLNTHNRGRCSLPDSPWRMRWWRLIRASFRSAFLIIFFILIRRRSLTAPLHGFQLSFCCYLLNDCFLTNYFFLLAALPALRRIISPWYLIPFPL